MLAGDNGPCGAFGHDWQSIGGRSCPKELTDGCSQPAFECARCGEIDYGDPGGPGHANCRDQCKHRGNHA
jgi:hypothetical protein